MLSFRWEGAGSQINNSRWPAASLVLSDVARYKLACRQSSGGGGGKPTITGGYVAAINLLPRFRLAVN